MYTFLIIAWEGKFCQGKYKNEETIEGERIIFRPNQFITNIKTPYLIQCSAEQKTSEVLATRASEVF